MNYSDIPSCVINGTCGVLDPGLRFGPLYLASPLYGIVFPVLTLITTIANSIIINILLRSNMRSPTNIILAAIAAFDLSSLLIQAPWHFYIFTLQNYSSSFLTIETCYIIELCVDTIPYLCHTTANWLTLGLSAQRYIYICKPYKTKQWCTIKRSIYGISFAFILSICHVLPRNFDRSYSVWDEGANPVCLVELADWVQTITPNVYFNIYFWFRVVFVQCLPCVLVTIFNGYLLLALRRAHQAQSGLLSKNSTVRRTTRTTYMLIILNIVFLLVEVPLSVLIMLHAISSSFYEFLDYDIANLLVLIFTFLIILSYPINFGIYCTLSSQFLASFKSLMKKSRIYSCCTKFWKIRRNSFKKQYKRCSSQTPTTMV